MVKRPTFHQIEGGLWGLLVGDAVGVPYEFRRPEELPPVREIQMQPLEGFVRSYPSVPIGTWSDDGAQALCLAASLLNRGEWCARDFAGRMLAWYREGYMAVDGRVFDVGIQTGAALDRLMAGTVPEEAGLCGERNNGNGSLMRVLPAALLSKAGGLALVAIAHEQSLVTHGHPRSQVCCALYCLWARHELGGEPMAWDAAVRELRSIYPISGTHRVELEEHVLPAMEATPTGMGYVVDSLASARAACECGSYEEIVQAAVAFGNDTDTTACLAGGIAGIRHGRAGIPPRWAHSLRGRNILDPLLDEIEEAIRRSGQ
jgi:ADP-ribosyl-[dinitrogen reductase] hydrolase